MFQIAAAIGYAKKFGYRWAADFETGKGPQGEADSSIHKVFPNLPKYERQGRIYREHPAAVCPVHGTHYDYCHFDYHPFVDRGDNVTLFGFWQSYRYFEEVQEEVKKVFSLDRYEDYKDYTSVHVRRGDYVQHSGSFPPVTVDYVNQAIKIINPEKVLVFSDDIDWCMDNLLSCFENCEVIEFEGDDWNDRRSLSSMASCGNHIIANSSYSWWGAYLGWNPDKIVVSPSHKKGNWFGHSAGVVKDCVDLIPKTWKEIEFR